MKDKKKSIRWFIALHILLLVYSFGGIVSKFASKQIFMSWKFILLYGILMCILFLYAVCWQQILKRMNLLTAYASKSVTVIWGILWGNIFFGEIITIGKVIGSIIIIAGVYLVVSGEEE